MSRIQFEDGGEGNDNSLRPVNSEVSKPTRRQRWATRRLGDSSGLKKRVSIVDRLHKRNGSGTEEKRKSAGSSSNDGAINGVAGPDGQQETRRIFFNMPIPDEERDEEGTLKAQYPRNKIRTAKYTPLSFIPKNLWLQFHNIANLYFLFIIILGVSVPPQFPGHNRAYSYFYAIVLSNFRCHKSRNERRAPDCHYRRDGNQRCD